MDFDFIAISPFLFVIISILIYLELLRINSKLDMWEITSLSLIPICLAILYGWIGFFSPEIEHARMGIRIVIAISLAIGYHVSLSVRKNLEKGAYT
jgi:hypothetical protein